MLLLPGANLDTSIIGRDERFVKGKLHLVRVIQFSDKCNVSWRARLKSKTRKA